MLSPQAMPKMLKFKFDDNTDKNYIHKKPGDQHKVKSESPEEDKGNFDNSSLII